jgi:hypothetical protein
MKEIARTSHTSFHNTLRPHWYEGSRRKGNKEEKQPEIARDYCWDALHLTWQE